jgi:hypothetical protein
MAPPGMRGYEAFVGRRGPSPRLSFLKAILQVAFIDDYYIDLFHLCPEFYMESISSWTGITLKPNFPQGHLLHGGLHKRASLPLNRVTV